MCHPVMIVVRTAVDAKRKAIAARIARLEDAIAKAVAYIERGEHADWCGFRPLFVEKRRSGKRLPPHRDWVRNVFLVRAERDLRHAERTLDRMESSEARACRAASSNKKPTNQSPGGE